MYTIVENLYQNIPHKSIFQRDGDAVKLVRWHASSDDSRPALIFIPEHLTQQSPTKDLDVWTPKIKEIAKHYDFDAWGLYWYSEKFRVSAGFQQYVPLFICNRGHQPPLPLGFTLLPIFALESSLRTLFGNRFKMVNAGLLRLGKRERLCGRPMTSL